tara:strand:- start:308 stop:496 length:189 start_codon:yes stop_codon:yes gene_type:complete
VGQHSLGGKVMNNLDFLKQWYEVCKDTARKDPSNWNFLVLKQAELKLKEELAKVGQAVSHRH